MKKYRPSALWLLAAALVLLAPSAGSCESAPPEGETIEHQVREGDSLSLMAGYYLRDPRQWRRIFEMNLDVIADPSFIVPGTALRVPSSPDRRWNISYGEFLNRVYR